PHQHKDCRPSGAGETGPYVARAPVGAPFVLETRFRWFRFASPPANGSRPFRTGARFKSANSRASKSCRQPSGDDGIGGAVKLADLDATYRERKYGFRVFQAEGLRASSLLARPAILHDSPPPPRW